MSSDDAQFNAIFTGDASQLKTSVDEAVAYLNNLTNKIYGMGGVLQTPIEMLQKFNNVIGEISSTGNFAKQLEEIILKATNLKPVLNAISEFTGQNFVEADINATTFAKGLALLGTSSIEVKSAYAQVAEQIGTNNPLLLEAAQNFKTVEAALSSFASESVFAKDAQAALKDPVQLTALAMEKLDTSIVNADQRLISLVSQIDLSNTSFTSLQGFIDSVKVGFKNAESAILDFSQANQGNNVVIEFAIERFKNFQASLESVRTSVKSYIADLYDSGRATELFVNKSGQLVDQNKQIQTEMGQITKICESYDTILKVLNGTQDTSVKSVLELVEAHRSNKTIYTELIGLIPQVTAETATLTSTQKLLAQILEDITGKFGSTFANVFQNIASQISLTDEVLLNLYSRLVLTAEAITRLISQGEQLVGMFINQVRSQDEATLSIERQATAVMQVIEWFDRFKTALLSVESIQAAMVGEQNAQTQALLTYEGVLNTATGVYDKFFATSKELIVVQGQTNAAMKEGFDPVERLALAKERLRSSMGSLIEGFSTLISTLKSFAVFTAASVIISGITDAFHSVISSASDFDQTLHSLKAITGATNSEMLGMNDVIKNIASNSTYSIESIGKGLQNMAQAGFTVEESANAIQAATNLAMGTLEDLRKTVDLVTSTLISYSLNSSEAGRVSDILATACNQSKLAIEGLRTSLNYVGVIAAQSGLSLQETTASLMVLADRGMKASTMGTGLRQVLDKLIAPNEKLREAYQLHGIELDKISPLTAGYETALKNLSTALWDSQTQTVNTAKAFELFGIRGAQAATVLIQTYISGEWKDALNSLNESGTAAKMAAEQMEGLSAKWEKLQAKASALSASLGEGGLVTVMKTVVLILTTLIDGFQSFLNHDFGIIGTITELFITFAASVTLGVVAIKAALIVWESLVAVSLSLYLNFEKLTAALRAFYAVLIANPILALGVALGTIIALIQTYNSNIKEGIDNHNKLAKEANQAANVLELFQKVVQKVGDNSEKLSVEVSRLKSEFPELVKEIEKVSGVVDISTLSYMELNAAMQEVQNLKLIKSLTEYTSAFYATQKAVTSTHREMVALASGGYELVESTEITKDGVEKLNEVIKNIGKTLIEQGHQVEGGLDKQREAALKALETYLNANTKMESSRSSLTKIIMDNFDKEDERLKRSRDFNQKQFNDIGQFYKDLSALEKAEIQSTFDEHQKANDKLKKMKDAFLITEEEYQASLYATNLKYVYKEYALIDENRKKQYESALEKYTREISLIDKEVAYTEQSLQKEQALYDEYFKTVDGWNIKQVQQMNVHLDNIATAQEALEQKRREKSKVTYEYQKQLADDFLKALQANQSLQLSVLNGFENEKLKIEQKTAEVELQLIQKRIDAENIRFQTSLNGQEATAQQMLEHTERMKDLLNQELTARANTINKIVALGEKLVSDLKEQLDKDLENTKSIYATKYEIAKQHYDSLVFEAQNALTKEYEEITKKVRNEEVVDDLQLAAKIQYWDKSLQLAINAGNEEIRLRQEEYDKSSAILNQKLQVEQDFMTQVKGLWDDRSQYTTVSEQSQLESAQRLSQEQIAIWTLDTSTFKSESGKRLQTIIDEATVSGQSIEDQVNKRGIAYRKITDVSKEELDKQKRNYIETKDGIFEIIDKETLKVQQSALEETKAYKDGVEQKKNLKIEEVEFSIKKYEEMLTAVKKTLADEYSEHEKTVEAIKKVRESIVSVHEKVEDAIRKVRQTTMTEEKKYYDDIKIADEALNKARTTGMQKYVDDAWSKITSLSTGTIKLDNGTQLSAKETASKKEQFMREYEKVAKDVLEAEKKRLEENVKKLEESIEKNTKSMDEIKAKLLEFQQLEIQLKTEKFTQSIDKIMLGIDDVIKKLQSVKGAAPVEIDISQVDGAINNALGFIGKIKPAIEQIKQTPVEVSVTGKDQVPLNDYIALQKTALEAFKTFIGDLAPAVETAFKAAGYENKLIGEVVEQIKTDVKKLKEGEGSIDSIKPKLNISAAMNGVNEEAQTISKGIEEIKTKIGSIPKETKSKHTVDVTGVADLQAAIDKHSQLDDVHTNSYHTVHVSTVNDGETEEAGNQRTGGYIAARVGGFIEHFRSGGAFAGKIPGYGGGDIVNAMLEPGEFVMRKEAVKNIGVNALRQWNNLNSEAQRTLNPQAGASSSNQMFTGQLHTIDLNIGNDSNRIYAEPNVLNSLTSSLRRARLMKA